MISEQKKGFTLIEILIAVAILGIFSLGILSLQSIISTSQVAVYRNYLSVDEANRNITMLVREIRNSRTGENGAYPLEQAQDQQITFYSDIDRDNAVEKVRYFLSGSELSKGVINPVGVPGTYPANQERVRIVAENVRNGADPIFYYYNGDWPSDTVNNPLDTPSRLSDTKLMRVYLEINPEVNDAEKNFILESFAQLRNLKDNL